MSQCVVYRQSCWDVKGLFTECTRAWRTGSAVPACSNVCLLREGNCTWAGRAILGKVLADGRLCLSGVNGAQGASTLHRPGYVLILLHGCVSICRHAVAPLCTVTVSDSL